MCKNTYVEKRKSYSSINLMGVIVLQPKGVCVYRELLYLKDSTGVDSSRRAAVWKHSAASCDDAAPLSL